MERAEEEERETQQQQQHQTCCWGTWEELLLVSAINRHGTNNWNSVAMEVQNRTNSFLTPHNCKQRYQHLRRRFMAIDDDDDTKLDESKTDSKLDGTIPWLDELRKLRVAELKREVQQYDVSIVSLQLKVKRLREERERSSKEKENGAGEVAPDLDKIRPEPSSSSAAEDVTAAAAAEVVAEKPSSGEDENQSFNESNSSDPKSENRVLLSCYNDESKKEKHETVADPVGGGLPEEKPAGEGSCNGSSETIKDSVSQAFEKSLEAIPKREPGESTELWESVAESKGSSDVQSSASLSSKENRRKKEASVSSSGEEPETDEISPAIKRMSVKSHPLGKVLEIIKSHKYGYVFERRLDSQETSKYNSLIRQHLDLEIVNKRLREGQYSGCNRKFFRDLLLLINNAIVFFPNNSVEFSAAVELRRIVSKEMKSRIWKSSQSSDVSQAQQPTPNIPPPALPKTEPEPEPSDSLLVKPKASVPIIVCRKRSSITSKGGAGAAAGAAVGEKKVEKKEAVVEEKKAVVDRKQQDNGVASLMDEQIVIKKGKRDRPTSGARSSRKSHNNSSSNKASTLIPSQNPTSSSNPSCSSKAGGMAADDSSEKAEKDKKSNNVNTVAKKRSVANFLNRMKKNTTCSSNGTLLEALKNSDGSNPNNGKVGGSAEEKKNSGGKGDEGRKEEATKQSPSKKPSNSPAKRSVGRPPKRNASSSSPATPPPPSKRSRETEAAPRQPRKRSRR